MSFWIEGVCIPIVSSFGLIGNLASIHVLRSRARHLDLNSNFVMLLICLAVFDFLFLIFAILMYSVTALLLPDQSGLHILSIPYILPLTNMTLTGSVYSVVAVTVERYTTLNKNNGKNVWKGRALIIFIVLFSVLYNLVKFFELYVDTETISPDGRLVSSQPANTSYAGNFTVKYVINATEMRRHPAYSLCYIVVGNFIVMNLFPLTVIAVLNYSIFKTIKSHTAVHNNICNTHRRDTTMVALLFSIVFIFMICQSPRLSLNIYEAYQMFRYGQMQEWPSWAAYMVYINHLFLVINSSSNIIIYVAKDFKFRAALWQSLTCQSHARHHDTLRMRRRKEENNRYSPTFDSTAATTLM